MKITVSFHRVGAFDDLQELRDEYLDTLKLAQEASLEVLMPDASHYAIQHDGVRCGYVSIQEPDTLIEFHLRRPYWVFGECVFEQLLGQALVKRALVKSFDHLLLSSCIARHTSLRVKGLLVRDIELREERDDEDDDLTSRMATLEDLPRLLAVDQLVFRHPERLQRVVVAGCVQLFERADTVVGFGIARPIIAGRKYVELGIAVDKPFRSRGLSARLFRAMMDTCIARGLMPVAGVAVENAASRAMGERAGMVANYRLLDLAF